MSIMTTGTHSRLLEEGLRGLWGQEVKRHPEEWKPVFDMVKSSKAYEDFQGTYGLGMAPEKDEGSAVMIDSGGQGFSKRFTNITYAMGVNITREAIEDNLYLDLSATYTKEIAKALRETKENLAANVLNRAFNSSYTGADGKELCATDHNFMAGGTFSNELATPAALSETSLEDMLIQIDGALDERQLNRNISASLLIIPKELRHVAFRLLESDKQALTANNAVNAIRGQNLIPKGFHVMRRLSSSTAHFIKTDAEKGLMMMDRVAPSFDTSVDFDTYNLKLKGRMRCDFGHVDPRGVYGNSGA